MNLGVCNITDNKVFPLYYLLPVIYYLYSLFPSPCRTAFVRNDSHKDHEGEPQKSFAS
jgi:hypothetical protein